MRPPRATGRCCLRRQAHLWSRLFQPAQPSACALCLPFIFEATKSNPLDRAIGELSYSVYLGHAFLAPALLAGCKGLGWLLPPVVFSALLVVSSLVLAVGLHYGVERPIDELRQRRVAQAAL